jgi:hypothetical protein
MNDLYDEASEIIDIEQKCRDFFDLEVKAKRVIASNVQTGSRARTTIFEADQHTVYALCVGDETLVLRDVQRMAKGMGIEPEAYLPPHGNENYFAEFGQQAIRSMYPGRMTSAGLETNFYQTLAPYSPALVQIARINGEIREYHSPLQQWQKLQDCSYAKVQVR